MIRVMLFFINKKPRPGMERGEEDNLKKHER